MVINNSIENKNILIAPLNWGLGHATRCIPIINALIEEDFKPVLAGDGDSLALLKKEFPQLKSYELPSYNIRYTKKGSYLRYRILFDSLKILKAVKAELQVVDTIIEKENINGIISDNRFGVRSAKVPSVYITHQVNVLSGITTPITSKMHQKIISKFDECWVPDHKDWPNLANELSHPDNTNLNLKYIGPISRFDKKNTTKEGMTEKKKYDVMILLSGPEPQRTILEEKLLNEIKSSDKKVLFVRGILSENQQKDEGEKLTIINYLLTDELQKAIVNSKVVLARSGYTTIMDLNSLQAKAFFIPTPGQFEQEYLAKVLENQKLAPYARQNDFKLEMLDKVNNYQGFRQKKTSNRKDINFPFDAFIR